MSDSSRRTWLFGVAGALFGCRPTPRVAETSGASRASIRVVSLGDSFTAGTGASPEQSFPVRLVARWRTRGWNVSVENPAVAGFTTEDLIATELSVLERVRPTYVTLAIGANNVFRGETETAYRRDLRVIFQAILRSGVTPRNVIVLPQPEWGNAPLGQSFSPQRNFSAAILRFNEILREETQRVGARWCAMEALLHEQAQRSMWAADGLHPTAEAYDAWAAFLAEHALPE